MFKGYIIEQLIRERKIKKADVYRYALPIYSFK